MAQKILNRPVTRLEALEMTHDMMLLDTPEYLIRDALKQYGFYPHEVASIIREARGVLLTEEHRVAPQTMVVGLVVITVIMLLIVIGLLISAIL